MVKSSNINYLKYTNNIPAQLFRSKIIIYCIYISSFIDPLTFIILFLVLYLVLRNNFTIISSVIIYVKHNYDLLY